MKIMYEGEELFEQEFLEISEEQFNELVDRSAIFYDSDHKMGYWLKSYNTWNILAIGLDQEPGGFDLEFESETKIQ